MTTRNPRLTRAGDLLLLLDQTGVIAMDAAAPQIGVSVAVLRECMEGRTRLPIDAQLQLATITLEHAPALARKAYALRGQAQTAKRVEQGEVVSHMISRPRWTI